MVTQNQIAYINAITNRMNAGSNARQASSSERQATAAMQNAASQQQQAQAALMNSQVNWFVGESNVALNQANAAAVLRNAATNERNASSNALQAEAAWQNTFYNERNAETNRMNALTNQFNASTQRSVGESQIWYNQQQAAIGRENATSARISSLASQSQAESAKTQAGAALQNAATNAYVAETQRTRLTEYEMPQLEWTEMEARADKLRAEAAKQTANQAGVSAALNVGSNYLGWGVNPVGGTGKAGGAYSQAPKSTPVSKTTETSKSGKTTVTETYSDGKKVTKSSPKGAKSEVPKLSSGGVTPSMTSRVAGAAGIALMAYPILQDIFSDWPSLTIDIQGQREKIPAESLAAYKALGAGVSFQRPKTAGDTKSRSDMMADIIFNSSSSRLYAP